MSGFVASIVRQLKRAIAERLETVISVTDEAELADLTFKEINEAEKSPRRYLPAASILLGFVDAQEYATGGIDQAQWRFIVRLYFDLTTGDKAQDEYEELLPEVLRAFRHDVTLGGKCDNTRIQDGGDPIFSRGTKMLVKTLYIIPETEED